MMKPTTFATCYFIELVQISCDPIEKFIMLSMIKIINTHQNMHYSYTGSKQKHALHLHQKHAKLLQLKKCPQFVSLMTSLQVYAKQSHRLWRKMMMNEKKRKKEVQKKEKVKK